MSHLSVACAEELAFVCACDRITLNKIQKHHVLKPCLKEVCVVGVFDGRYSSKKALLEGNFYINYKHVIHRNGSYHQFKAALDYYYT